MTKTLTNNYLKKIINKFNIDYIQEVLNSLEDLKVLIIGDTIIDEYCFVDPRGGAIKDPMLTVDYLNEEIYAGGILAIANHVSNFVKEVKLVTMIGDKMNYQEFINKNINKNIKLKIFVKEGTQTTRKRRYLNKLRDEKIFMIEYINDSVIKENLENEIVNFLERELNSYDLVIVGDFGHGFINENIIKILEEKTKYLALNVQTNSANLGFNYVTKYNKPSFVTMDGTELSFAIGDKQSDIVTSMNKLYEKSGFNNFLVTLGKNGVAYFKEKNIYFGQSLTTNVKDVVGAGDAVFSILSLIIPQEQDPEFIPFIANCVGGIAVNIICNKESITKEKIMSFIKKLYKETEEINIDKYFNIVNDTLKGLDKSTVIKFVKQLLKTYNNNGTIYAFGNGGSGATASHFCGDLVKGVSYGSDKRFKAICLNDNTPAMMSIANDISYDDIFIEQLKNFLTPNDLVVGISGSGNSTNVVKALEYAKQIGAKTSAICGYKGGKIKEISDISIHAQINDMEITEDIHNLIIIHCVKQILTKELNNNNLGEEYLKRIS